MQQQPPKYALRFLRWFCREDFLEEIEGDLVELFEHRLGSSVAKAKWSFVWDVLKSFRPINFKKLKITIMINSILNHTFKTGFRQMSRNRLYTGINITGLALSMVIFMLITLYVRDEKSFDKFHSDHEQIFRLLKTDEDRTEKWAYNPPALGPAIKEAFPEISEQTRVFYMNWADASHENKKLSMTKGFLADSSFFEFFDFPVVLGQQKGLLDNRSNIVISKEIADTYFTESDPIGSTIDIGDQAYLVSAVVEVPDNTHLDFDFVIPIKSMFGSETLAIWKQSMLYTYVKTNFRDPSEFEAKAGTFIVDNEPTNEGIFMMLQPLAEIHHDPSVNGQMAVPGNGFYLNIFLLAGIILMIIACINFMNLILGRVVQRVKEVGVRKINGANRKLIMLHFMGESLLIVVIAFFLASLVAWQLLPSLNLLTGKTYAVEGILQAMEPLQLISASAGMVFLLTVLSSLYPSLIISGIKPINMLKGWFSVRIGSVSLSRVLNTFQFAVSIVLIIGSLMVLKQLRYMDDKPLGWDKDNLVAIGIKSGMFKQFDLLKNELLKNESISSVTWVSELPIDVRTGGLIEFEGMNPEKQHVAYYLNGGKDFYETFRMKSVEGLPFREIQDDSKSNYVINESMMKYLQEDWGPDVSPIGKELDKGVIVGVVKDYHWQPLSKEIGPILYGIDAKDSYGNPGWFVIRIKDGELKAGLSVLDDVYASVYPSLPYEYEFVDEKVGALYKAEQNTSYVLSIFSGVAIFVSCLGLFGLAFQAINNQIKSYSIRKVIGASTLDLFLNFAKSFGIVIGIAILLAVPSSYFLINQWLQNFAYQVGVDGFTFFAAIAGVIGTVLITLIIQFRRIVRTNPANILRNE